RVRAPEGRAEARDADAREPEGRNGALDEAAQHEEERLERVERVLEADRLLERAAERLGRERPLVLAARGAHQRGAGGAEPRHHLGDREPRQVAEPPDAPALERGGDLGRRREAGRRQRGEEAELRAGGARTAERSAASSRGRTTRSAAMARACATVWPARTPRARAAAAAATIGAWGPPPSLSASGRAARSGSARQAAATGRSGTRRQAMRGMVSSQAQACLTTSACPGRPTRLRATVTRASIPSSSTRRPGPPLQRTRRAPSSRPSAANVPASRRSATTRSVERVRSAARARRGQTPAPARGASTSSTTSPKPPAPRRISAARNASLTLRGLTQSRRASAMPAAAAA